MQSVASDTTEEKVPDKELWKDFVEGTAGIKKQEEDGLVWLV